MNDDGLRWIRDHRELLNPEHFNEKGVYGLEYETEKSYFMPYETFINSQFAAVLQHHFAKRIVENSEKPGLLAVMLFRKEHHPKLYTVPTPTPMVTRSKFKSPFDKLK